MRTFLSVALVALLLVPDVAAAEAAEEAPPTATVRYRDLDLRSETGVRRLRTRVRTAAVAVCEEGGFRKTALLWTPDAVKCQENAIASAEPRVQLAVARARDTRLASVDPGELAIGANVGR